MDGREEGTEGSQLWSGYKMATNGCIIDNPSEAV